MKKFKNIVLILILIFIVLFLIFSISGGFYFYHLAIARNDKSFLFKSSSSNDSDVSDSSDAEDSTSSYAAEASAAAKSYTKSAAWLEKTGYEQVTIQSVDGLKLTAYYIAASVPTTKTIILAHGYNSSGKDMADFAQFFYEDLGYNVLLPDTRGHGLSEGDYVGFGWPDRLDYLKWIDWTIEKVGQNAQIGLLGVSMGGATVMMVSGENLPAQVKAIIEDCGYTSVADELAYQLKQMFQLPAFPLVLSTSIITEIRDGYNFYESSALEQVKKAKVPMLFIHGDADTFVPTYMVNELYENCGSKDKSLWIVPGAFHAMSFTVDPDGYETKISEFLSQYITD